jgi:aminopeptidase N
MKSLVKMRNLREHLLLCILITLLNGNVADKSPFYNGILTQNEDLSQNDDFIDYRLPSGIKPITYEIKLIPKLEDDFTFKGWATIDAVVESPSDSVTLHVGKYINIEAASASAYEPGEPYSDSYDNITEKYTIHFPKTLQAGRPIQIDFEYNGTLSDNMVGLYKSFYLDGSGKRRWLAATQLQTTHARDVFPCFDEPNYKAKFMFRLARDRDYNCLTNSKLNFSETLKPGAKTWDTFEQSVPMSTYLVAFIVSDFISVGSDFKVWTKPSVTGQAQHALLTGIRAIEMYGTKFNLNYEHKMDMVAVPDFAAGATENLGLVMYRESRILYDETESSIIAKQKVTSVIAHELAHMWFGNLVTPEWWSYLWLSEGFATYYEYFGTAELYRKWNMEEQFVVEQHHSALVADSLESSLPMTRDIVDKSQIVGDDIVYNKAASVIRMMSLLFGNENDIFEDAIRSYLTNNQQKGLANPDDLWKAIQDRLNDESTDPNVKIEDVKAVMDTWTTQAGYPVVSIAVTDNGVLSITQERFLLRNLHEIPTDIIWSVPLTFATKIEDFSNTIPTYWLTNNKSTADFGINPNEWFIFNVQSSGFYRVNYDDRGWKNIFNMLKTTDKLEDIHVLNRASIVDDLLNLGRAGKLNYDMVFEGLLFLKRETNYLPFKAAFNGLEYISRRFTGHVEHSLFKVYVKSLLENINFQLEHMDDENDDQLTVLLRQEVNKWLCNFDDTECVKDKTDKFNQWKEDTINARIKPIERTLAYCEAIKRGTSEDWEFLWDEYFISNYADDQVVILNALGCSSNTTILEQYLMYAISNYEAHRIRKHDGKTVFAAVYNSGLLGAEFVLDFVERHYKEMEEYYGGQSIIATILDGASQRFSTIELVNKFEKFINDHKEDLAPIQKSLDSSLEIAKYELKWYSKFSASIFQWLQAYDNAAYRLPKNIVPYEYVISVAPNFEDFTVKGKVTIEVIVKERTKQIILHSLGIKHDKLNLKDRNNEISYIDTKLKERYDFYVIYLKDELKHDDLITIEIEYTSDLNATDLRGFYKSSYQDEKGETRWLAASHLGPVSARKMFPCFDEPAMKAIFTVQVTVPYRPKGYEAISNRDWVDKKKTENGLLYTFAETKIMSTYLVAVVISDFKTKPTAVDETLLAVYARPNAIDQTDYALSVMSQLVVFFENTYKQKYQLSQLLMVALPDFSTSAMENWGLLTYRETSMLYDEDHSPTTNKQTIANVIAHEISHQWFGNLVSPLWWKYLWLNEGFAKYFEYHATIHVIENEPKLESQFVVDQVHSAFEADGLKSTHPLTHDVYSPREIRSMFDKITYAKGASIVRMIVKTFGTDVFNKALIDYLDKWKYKTATPEDLYKSLQLQVYMEYDIQVILDTWTTQPGYPVVNVDTTTNTIRQKRFSFNNEDNSDDTLWHIPITWAPIQNSKDFFDTKPKLWLTSETRKIDPSDSLLIFNTQQSGYYRVNYDPNHWMKIIDYLKNQDFETIHEINRAALVDDLMNLARADYIDYRTVLSALTYLEKENSYFPWRALFNNLPYLNNRFAGREGEGIYKKWLTSLIEQLYTRLNFEDLDTDDDLTKIFKMYTRKWACKLDIGDCTFKAQRYFQQKKQSKPIPPNYRDAVYCTVMRMDKTSNNFKYLKEEYVKSNVAIEKHVILNSLACSENEEVLETLLTDAITENSYIRYQDSARIFSHVYDASLIGVEAVMKIIEKKYDDIVYRFSNDHTKIANIMNGLATRLSTNDLYDKYVNLLGLLASKESEFEFSANSYLSKAKYEFDWYDKNVPEILEALDNPSSSSEYRLPKSLEPKLYNIHITPDFEEGTFEGKVEINIKVKESTTLIALNSDKLNVSNIKITRNNKEIRILSTNKNIPQQLRIYLSAHVNTNEEIKAEMEFKGILNDDMKGFYRSSYTDSKGVQHWLATTHFAPTYARQAFPCFDEPAFKSKFTINIQRLKHYNSQSNMPRKSQPYVLKQETPKNENYMWDTFETTNVDMSTYLVAFVVSEFKSADDPKTGNINVWGRPEIAIHGKYAQDIGVEVIEILENITNINYALPKLDLMGIPDLSIGAMENWGIATFREEGLFYNKEQSTATYDRLISSVVAHELTHMWFGNLVTCNWWDYIWLNEGFAQYFEWFISDQIRPEYKYMDQFVVYELHPALAKDTSLSTHSMTNPVETPEEIAGIFDYVTYGKSASVLRMFFNAFDEEADILALRDYLTKRMYLTARPADLWESFQEFVSIRINNRNASIEEVMNTWVDQPGYPVVNATLTGSILTLTQERFLINKTSSANEFYWIPVDIFVSSDTLQSNAFATIEHHIWLGPEPEPNRIVINPSNDWFIVNYKQTGFYRVNYDDASWNRLIVKLKSKEFEVIDVLNRAQIVDDLHYLARAGYVEYELLMNAMTYLKQETNHLPWKAFFNGLSFIHERFEQQTFQKDLNSYMLEFITQMYEKVGFDERNDEGHLDKLNREMFLQWACKLNIPECKTKSVNQFKAWRNDTSNWIPRNARPAVYCTAIKEGNKDDWEFLWDQYLKANFDAEKKIIINALGCSTNKTVLEDYLEKAIKEYNPANAEIRRQDVLLVFASVYSAGPIGVNATLDFLMTNMEALYNHFGSWNEIADLFVNVASYISTDEQHNSLVDFVEHNISKYPPTIKLKLISAITTTETNILWYKNNGPKIQSMILKLGPEGDKPSSSTRIESLNIIFTILVALTSYLLSYH